MTGDTLLAESTPQAGEVVVLQPYHLFGDDRAAEKGLRYVCDPNAPMRATSTTEAQCAADFCRYVDGLPPDVEFTTLGKIMEFIGRGTQDLAEPYPSDPIV